MSNISSEFTLPSKGIIYEEADQSKQGRITLTSMTTNQEMQRLSDTDRGYQVMSNIINECIVDGIGVHPYDMAIPDYEFLLHRLRVVTYGEDYNIQSKCPYCGSLIEDSINLLELPIKEIDMEELAKYVEFDLPASKSHIKLRMQTPRMLDNIRSQTTEFKKKNQIVTRDQSLLYTVKSCIETIDYQKPNPFFVEDWISKLPMRDTNYILQCSDKLTSCFGVQTDLSAVCPVCGLDYNSQMRLTPEFFRPTIQF